MKVYWLHNITLDIRAEQDFLAFVLLKELLTYGITLIWRLKKDLAVGHKTSFGVFCIIIRYFSRRVYIFCKVRRLQGLSKKYIYSKSIEYLCRVKNCIYSTPINLKAAKNMQIHCRSWVITCKVLGIRTIGSSEVVVAKV